MKVLTEDGALIQEFPNHQLMLNAMRGWDSGFVWVEEDNGTESLYQLTPLGVSCISPKVITKIRKKLEGELAKAHEDAQDAARWRALVTSGRVRCLGAAGLTPDMPSFEYPYAHIGLEIWTAYKDSDPVETLGSVDLLTRYADKAISIQSKAIIG